MRLDVVQGAVRLYSQWHFDGHQQWNGSQKHWLWHNSNSCFRSHIFLIFTHRFRVKIIHSRFVLYKIVVHHEFFILSKINKSAYIYITSRMTHLLSVRCSHNEIFSYSSNWRLAMNNQMTPIYGAPTMIIFFTYKQNGDD